MGDAFAMAFMDTMNRASMIEIKLTEDELDEICTKEANLAANPELRRQRQRLRQVEPPAAKATRQAKIAAAMNAKLIEEGRAS